MRRLLALVLSFSLVGPSAALWAASPRKRGDKKGAKKITLKDLAPRYDELYKPRPVVSPSFTQAQLDALYDGAEYRPEGIQLRAENWKPEVEVQNEQLKRAALTHKPSGITFEGGYLGTASRNTLMGKSPYVGVRQGFDCDTDNWVDCKFRIQGDVIQVNGRYFNSSDSADPATDRFTLGVAALMREGGSTDAEVAEFQKLGTYDDPYKTSQIFIGSMLGQLGRAYNLLGPVDVGWTVTGLMRMSHFFPNVAADATMGTRVKLGDDRSVGLYGGATHNASPIGNRILQGFLTSEHPKYGYNGETSPHAAVQFKGPIPGEPGLMLDVTAYRQWNQYTQVDKIRGALGTDIGGRPTEIGASWMTERGPEIEFDRVRQEADITRYFSKNVAGSVGMYNEDFKYGSARLNQQAYMVGLKVNLDGSSDPGSVSVSHKFDGQDRVASPQTDFVKAADQLNQALSQALSLAEATQITLHQTPSPYSGDSKKNPERMDALAASIRAIPPATRNLYRLTLLSQTSDPAEQAFINDMFTQEHLDQSAASLEKGASVLRLMSDNGVIERFLTRVARNQMLTYLDKIEVAVPLVDSSFRWSPGVFLAATHALSGRSSPVSPITNADRKEILEPWIWKNAARSLHLPDNATPEQITAELIASGPPSMRAQLLAGGTATSKAFVEAIASLIMRELDEMMLNLIVEAEQQFDPLTVDGGRKAGELGTIATGDSFSKLDERNKSYHHHSQVLKKLADRYRY